MAKIVILLLCIEIHYCFIDFVLIVTQFILPDEETTTTTSTPTISTISGMALNILIFKNSEMVFFFSNWILLLK